VRLSTDEAAGVTEASVAVARVREEAMWVRSGVGRDNKVDLAVAVLRAANIVPVNGSRRRHSVYVYREWSRALLIYTVCAQNTDIPVRCRRNLILCPPIGTELQSDRRNLLH